MASAGSFISVVSTVVFFVMLFDAFYYRSQFSRIDNKAPIHLKRITKIKGHSLRTILNRTSSLLAVTGLPHDSQINFQLPASSIMEGIVTLHHDMMFFLVFISVFVLYILVVIGLNFNTTNKFKVSQVTHHSGIEIIWTIIPTIILVLIALPSFVLLYSMDELHNPFLTLKVIGRQWYWSYEYSDSLGTKDYPEIYNETLDKANDISFDAYMEPDVESEKFRLLKTDNTVYLPAHEHIRVLVTSSDVIHS